MHEANLIKASTPVLRFTPMAWAKLLFMRDYGTTEVSGFGIAYANDPLFIHDFQLLKQSCTSVTTEFDDESVADHFERNLEEGLKFGTFDRVWMHTHPGSCPRPSGTDHDTFDRVFSEPNWAIMFIIAEGGEWFARLRVNGGLNIYMDIPVRVDYSEEFDGADHLGWEQEYLANVTKESSFYSGFSRKNNSEYQNAYASGYDEIFDADKDKEEGGLVADRTFPLTGDYEERDDYFKGRVDLVDDGRPNRFDDSVEGFLDDNDGGMPFSEIEEIVGDNADHCTPEELDAWEDYADQVEDAEERAYERQLIDEEREFQELLRQEEEAGEALDRALTPKERARAYEVALQRLREIEVKQAEKEGREPRDFDLMEDDEWRTAVAALRGGSDEDDDFYTTADMERRLANADDEDFEDDFDTALLDGELSELNDEEQDRLDAAIDRDMDAMSRVRVISDEEDGDLTPEEQDTREREWAATLAELRSRKQGRERCMTAA